MEYRKGILKTKTKAFAVRVVKLYQYLSQTKNEHIMSKQLLRSGTAIGICTAKTNHLSLTR